MADCYSEHCFTYNQELTLYTFFLVSIDRSLNSNWIVLTSDTELSGPHSGACALPEYRFTSEKGISDFVLKQGNKRSPSST